MTKNIVKVIILAAITAMTLTGCMNNELSPYIKAQADTKTSTSTATEVTKPTISTSTISEITKPETSTETKVEQTSTASSTAEKPETSTTSSKPASSATTSSTSSSNPSSVATSSTATSSNPVEVPAHNHSFTKATCLTPATCTSCGATQGTLANHNFSNGTCTICGKNDPNYVAPHNCNRDGHVWGESYTKTYTEDFELKESHDVYANGFDVTLAERYCNLETIPSFSSIFGVAYGSGSAPVKTTATRTVTDYYHKCSECGASENYDTDETVTPSDNWKVVDSRSLGKYFTTIWWDIDNIPNEVYEAAEKDNQAREDFFNSL